MTTTSTAPAPSDSAAPRGVELDPSVGAFAIRAVALVALGGLVGGLVGAAAAAVGVASTWRRSASLVAGAAVAMLVAAAFATVFEVTPEAGALRSDFASTRPIAAAFGLVAGIFAIVAVVTMSIRERAPVRTPPVVPAGDAAASVAALTSWIRANAALLGVVAATVVIRAVTLPDALPGGWSALVVNLRAGAGFVVGTSGSYRPSGTYSPVPAVVAAFGPGGAGVALVLASALEVGLAGLLARRVAGHRAGVAAALATLVISVLTAQRLPSALGGALLLATVLLALPPRHGRLRAVAAGLTLGLAMLSIPLMVVAVPLVAALMAFGRPGRNDGSLLDATLTVVVAVLTCLPWVRYVHSRFGTWTLSTDMGVDLGAITAFLPLVAVVVAVAVVRWKASPTPD